MKIRFIAVLFYAGMLPALLFADDSIKSLLPVIPNADSTQEEVVPLRENSAGAKRQMALFLDNLTTLKAGFEQSILDSQHRSATRTQGTFYLKRPGRFRWDYSEPEQQQIIADGSSIWLLEPDLKQVSVQGQESALQGTPAMLLVTDDPVETHFEVIDIGRSQNLFWVELIPRKEESQFIRILLAFKDNQLKRMEMTDQFGQISRIQFYDVEQNLKLDDQLFVYERPNDFDLYTH